MCRGKICEKCKRRRYTVLNTKRKRALKQRIQYLGCPECKYRPENNKVVSRLVEYPPIDISELDAAE